MHALHMLQPPSSVEHLHTASILLQVFNCSLCTALACLQHVTAADDAAGATAREQWVVCPIAAPDVPEGFKLMASEHLPISTYHFYEQFLSVEATCLQDHHRSTGQYDFRSSRCE
jgi:hypothetical protein